MNPDTWWIIKVAFQVIYGIFAILGALLLFLDFAHEEKQEPIKAWFRKKWDTINKSSWLMLPEMVILMFLDILVDAYHRYSGMLFSQTTRDNLLIYTLNILYIINFFPAHFAPNLLASKMFLTLTITNYDVFNVFVLSYFYKLRSLFFFMYRTTPWPIRYAACIYYATKVLLFTLTLDILEANTLILLTTPAYWFILGAVVVALVDRFSKRSSNTIWFERMRSTAFLLGGATVGFHSTSIALLLGNLMVPFAPVPQTVQMFLLNIIADNLAIVSTSVLLFSAVSKKIIFRLPIAILLILIINAVTACSSLFFGLLSTEQALSLWQVLHVLIGKTPDGSRVELSPYFWVMHTTFIPVFLYLLLLSLCWLIKLFLTPVRWFFGAGQEHKNPLKLAAYFCGVIVAIFTLLYYTTNSFYERAKEKSQIQSPVTQSEK